MSPRWSTQLAGEERAAAESLLTDDHLGDVVPITGPEAITRAEQIATIERSLHRGIPVIEITPEEFCAETGQFIPEPVMKMLLHYWSDTLTTPTVRAPSPRSPADPGARSRNGRQTTVPTSADDSSDPDPFASPNSMRTASATSPRSRGKGLQPVVRCALRASPAR